VIAANQSGLDEKTGKVGRGRLLEIDPETGTRRDVTPVHDAGCIADVTRFGVIGAVGDRAVLGTFCLPRDGSGPVVSVSMFDPTSGVQEALLPKSARLRTGSLSWNPATATGLWSNGDGICGQLALVTAASVEALPKALDVRDGERTWQLPSSAKPKTAPCPDEPIVGPAEWGPSGKTFAFVATDPRNPKGFEGLANSPWVLGIADLDGGTTTTLVRGFHDPGGVSWSRDGRWIALRTSDATLIYDTTNRTCAVSTRRGPIGWSPDGRYLYGLTGDGFESPNQIVRMPVDHIAPHGDAKSVEPGGTNVEDCERRSG
jgi:hypothetical protein